MPALDFDDAVRAGGRHAGDRRGADAATDGDDFDDDFDLDEPSAGRGRAVRSRVVRLVGGRSARWAARTRFDPGRRGALAVGAAALVVAVVAGAWVFFDRPRAAAVAPHVLSSASITTESAAASSGTGTGSGSVTASAPGSSRTPALIVVDVVGRVKSPGIYQLPSSARVADALAAAGGALPGVDLTSVNLAARVSDGQQIAIGVPGAPAAAEPAPGTGGTASVSASSPVDLNTAGVEQLDGLPGVGPVLAQHIVDWRSAHGQFTSIDQLREVSGIGPSKFAAIKSLVTV